MSVQAQYASFPRVGQVSISTANTNRNGTGTIGTVFVATPTVASGSRIDRIDIVATGTTTTNVVRLFLTAGRAGVPISSMVFSTTTVTVTTTQNHGMSTGDFATVANAVPDIYNIVSAPITVTGLTTFTYTVATAPTTNAITVGAFSSTPSTPVTILWREVLVTAITPSTSQAVFSQAMSSGSVNDVGYLPLILPTGWSLRAATNNAESYNVIANGGDLA